MVRSEMLRRDPSFPLKHARPVEPRKAYIREAVPFPHVRVLGAHGPNLYVPAERDPESLSASLGRIPSAFSSTRDIKPFFPRAKPWTSSLKGKPVI